MRNMQCPKCRSKTIVRLPGDITLPPTVSGGKSPASVKTIKTTHYCCAHCGFTEVWVDNPDDLKDLLKKFGF